MRLSALIIILLLSVNQSFADEDKSEFIRDKLSKHFPINSVQYMPEVQLYQLVLPDGTTLFSDETGEHFVVGALYSIENGVPINVTERARDEERIAAVALIKDEDMVIFPSESQSIGSIYVFTDVDCSYCRRLHSEMDIYNTNGITVKYIAWPRCGTRCISYDKMVSVWCAEDRRAAMDLAKSGAMPDPKICDNPVEQQYKLGVKLGLRGTPFILLDNGDTIPGYKPASEIIEMFNKG